MLHDFENEQIVLSEQLHHLGRQCFAELVRLKDGREPSEDMLRLVISLTLVEQEDQHFLDESLEILLGDCCVLNDFYHIFARRVA